MLSVDAKTLYIMLAVIAVLVIIVIGLWALSRKPARKKNAFMPGDPASPLVRDAIARIEQELEEISNISDNVGRIEAEIKAAYDTTDMGPAFNEARLVLAGAQRGLEDIAASIKSLKIALDTMPPTYQNALGLYKGLRDGDKALLLSARALDANGERMMNLITSIEDHDESAQSQVEVLNRALRTEATQLHQLSMRFYDLLRSVHALGRALDLE